MEGEILIENGKFGTKDAAMKLGRNKYKISVTEGDKEAAEIKIGEKLASSLF
jgi:L-arabinose isomerase